MSVAPRVSISCTVLCEDTVFEGSASESLSLDRETTKDNPSRCFSIVGENFDFIVLTHVVYLSDAEMNEITMQRMGLKLRPVTTSLPAGSIL